MKKGFALILAGLLVTVAMPVIAEEKPATQLEQFTTKKGEIIIKEFYELGKLSGHLGEYLYGRMEIKALVIYQPGMPNKLYGLKIYIKEGGEYSNENTSFLDFGEIKALSEALGYMIELSKKWASIKKEYIEVIFQTQGDYKIGFYQKELKQSAFSESGRIGSASIYLTMKDLETFKSLIDEGLAKLESLGAE